MPRVKKGRGKKSHACLTCLIVCLVVVVLFTVGIIVGANVAFNKIVSPQIGGVTLSESLSLVRGIYKSDRSKIVTNEYTEDDLNDFYKSLNSVLYQSEKTEEEFQEEYNALSDDEKSELTYEQYKEKNPYRITVKDLTEAINLGGNTEDGNAEGEGELAAAEESIEGESGSEDNSLTSLFKKLSFDFSSLKDYPYTAEEDLTYTNFEITGNQLAAVAGEIMKNIIDGVDLSQYAEGLNGVKLSEYVGIPQITTLFTEENTSETYNNSVKLSAVVELNVKELVNAIALPMLQANGSNAESIMGFVSGILPKSVFVTVGVYPLNDSKEMELSINNYNGKQQENLKRVVNALTNGLKLFDDKKEENNEGGESMANGSYICYADDTPVQEAPTPVTEEVPSVFTQVNQLVTGVFDTLNGYMPVSFVTDEVGSATLRMAHIQGMLSLMGMYDPENIADSVTPHEFLTTLRCLIDEALGSSNEESLDSLYDQLSINYGVDRDYWNDHNLLDSETMDELPSVIDVSKVTYRDNAKMKVFMHEGQLTTLIADAIKNGMFDSSEEETAPAGEEGEESGTDILDMISFDQILISSVIEESVSNVTYLNSAEESKVLASGVKKVYKLDIQASIDIAKLLTQNSDEDIMVSLSKALPDKLCLAVVMYVADLEDEEGTVVKRYVGGDEAGKTQFRINKYDEANTVRVINVIQKMLSSLGVDNEFSIDSITTQLEDGFAKVFDTVSDTLYCTIGFSDNDGEGNSVGSVVLPSIYEVVYGISTKKIEESEGVLTLEDRLAISEIQALFVNIYNTDIKIAEFGESVENPSYYDILINKYDSTSGDRFLDELSSKYYLKNKLSSSALFGDGGLDNLVTEDSINFTGYTDGTGEEILGLYKDSAKTLDDLKVSLSGSSLADLINKSGKLDSLASAEGGSNDFIEKLEILCANYDWSEDKSTLWLDLEFSAYFDKSDGEGTEGFSIGKFLPESVILTARILLYSNSYDEDSRFSTEVLINKDDITKISKLIKVFSGEFSTDDITNQVSDAIKSAFDNIEGSINITYDSEKEASLIIGNIFNTINKLSHKDDEAYVQSDADDNALKVELQEFGREPEYTINDENIINSADIKYYISGVVYSSSNADDFYDRINTNYYIKDGEHLNSEKIKENVIVNTSILDFTKLYDDTRDYSAIDTSLYSLEFTAIANDLVSEQLDIKGEGDARIGRAEIIQSYIAETSIKLVLRFEVDKSSTSGATAMLPDYIFLTTYTSLTSTDESGVKNYETEVLFNSYENYDVTKDLFDRITLLQSSLGMDLGFTLNDLTGNISSGIKSVFEEYFVAFGKVETGDDYIKLPTVFEYLTNGTLVDGQYDSSKKMFEICPDTANNHYYAVFDGKVGYYSGATFNTITVRNSEGDLVDAVAETRDGLLGYAKYDSVGHESFVVIQTHPEDLMADLREFGRMPEETKVVVNEGDKLGYFDAENSTFKYRLATEASTTYRGIGLSYTIDDDGYHAPSGDYYYDDAEAFLNIVNRNYYVKDDKQITLANLSDQMVIESSLFNFQKLYDDTRDYDEIVNKLTGARLTAISNGFYESGIAIDGGNADIVQMHIFSGANKINGYIYLRTVVRVSLVNGASSNILPEYLYVACYTNIDPTAGDAKYETELVINDFGYNSTFTTLEERVIATNLFLTRLDSLKSNFNVSYSMDMDNIKATLKDKFSDIFENKLSIFGEIRIEDNAIIIPNVFEYLTQGQLVKEGGETVYKAGDGYRMLEQDSLTQTSPETFMNRLRELGRSDILNSDGSMSVWVDGSPYLGVDKNLYNDNSLNLSADAFYSEMQAYYFLKDKPSQDTFTSGSDVLSNLTTDLSGIFNLNGITSDSTNTSIKAYMESGLYNYNGDQKYPLLSDKALASLINGQSSIDLTAISSVADVQVTSIKITSVSNNQQIIEITAKVDTVDATGIMPEHFYITTITTRTTGVGDPTYSTTVTLNRFAEDDFLNFKANIDHIAVIGFKNKLETESISTAVEDALKSTFDDKLASYQSGFGNYAIEDRTSSGFGYIKFKNVYDVLVEKTGATKTETSSKDIQNVIYKLHNLNENLLANEGKVLYNPLTSANEMTDRNIAYILSETTVLDVCQAIIFTGTHANYNGFENMFKGHEEDFAFQTDVSYIFSTVKIDTSDISSDVAFLPSDVYASVLVDGSNNVKYTFLNDFNASEQALFESFIEDSSNKLDVKDIIKEKLSYLKDFYSFGSATYVQGDFTNYYGKLTK